jgi:hypothetical protein
LRFNAGSGFYHAGIAAATLDANPAGTVSINYLTATLPLQNYALSTDVELSFWYMHHGEESHSHDRVWIRGSDQNAWVEIYNLYANKAATGTYKHVTGIDIDAALSAAGQAFTPTFQIRFGQEDNYPASTTTSSDGFTFDDITLTGTIPTPNDISVVSIEQPVNPVTPGSNPVKVVIKNNGTDTLKTATITYSVDGATQTPSYSWSDTLLFQETDTVVLGNFNFVNGYHSLKVWGSNPNGQTDGNHNNDTIMMNMIVCSPFSGIYTIGPDTSDDFASITLAVNALNQCGVAGPVTFLIDSGIYNGAIAFNAIPGASATNTITFK